MKNTPTLPLYIALGTPLVFILGVVGYIILIPLFVSPEYDLVYAHTPFTTTVSVTDEGVRVHERRPEERELTLEEIEESVTFYRFYSNEERSETISYSEVKDMDMNTETVSPDGFSVRHDYGRSDPFSSIFGGRGHGSGHFLEGSGYRVRITNEDISSWEFQFLGWISRD